MHKCSSTILYAACTFRPYKSAPVLKLFRTFTGKMTRGLSLQMVFSPLFVETLLFPTPLPSSKMPLSIIQFLLNVSCIQLSNGTAVLNYITNSKLVQLLVYSLFQTDL